MALTAPDFIYPNGELMDVMFPGDDLELTVGVWLDEATAKTTVEDAQMHWVYYRAYTAVANRIAATPSNQSTSQGAHSVTWSGDRVKTMQDKATYHRQEYDRLAEDESLGQPFAYFGRARVIRTTT